jgi:hypothetical protein
MLLVSRPNHVYLGRFRYQLRKLSSANGKKYNELVLGVPKEIFEGKRISLNLFNIKI